jgi:coproporphyrinogen III oxidase-like Fe-S oxidoreductase
MYLSMTAIIISHTSMYKCGKEFFEQLQYEHYNVKHFIHNVHN